ncbi:class I SAM-dependent methyltransferase [Evansella clarkii]|uniref:class I SAM-dependent methyltransferase n=1 Tax=Evansella clarkii TaxID=79879 RepID=UPI000B446C86|nr:class I SAM-dependent methyltransferase [Evansella clarkii]
MSRVEFIRKAEKEYHDYCYENYKLFKEGSWLYKPVKTVLDTIPLLEGKTKPKVLDLGSGVGRNSIPIAQEIKNKNGKVVCVDLLDSALDKLIVYSEEYEVGEVIETIKADIGHYEIAKLEYGLIIAVSTLEHVESEDVFENTVQKMASGTKHEGINCIIVNSEVEEIDIESNENLNAMMEVNIKTENMLNKLKAIYDGWDIVNKCIKPLEYQIVRDKKEVLLKTNAITFVVKKK